MCELCNTPQHNSQHLPHAKKPVLKPLKKKQQPVAADSSTADERSVATAAGQSTAVDNNNHLPA